VFEIVQFLNAVPIAIGIGLVMVERRKVPHPCLPAGREIGCAFFVPFFAQAKKGNTGANKRKMGALQKPVRSFIRAGKESKDMTSICIVNIIGH
jgi:hypothetical protein